MDREWRNPTPPEWEYVPEGWARRTVDERIKGWQRIRHRRVVQGEMVIVPQRSGIRPARDRPRGVQGRPDKGGDLAAHNTLLTFGYVLARASRAKDRVAILDWGGATGHYFVIAKALVPEMELLYHCKEVPEVCAVGRELLPEI